MMESTFFYTGVIAFSMMVLGLGFTVFEFRKLGQSQKAARMAGGSADLQNRHESADSAGLKVVNAGRS